MGCCSYHAGDFLAIHNEVQIFDELLFFLGTNRTAIKGGSFCNRANCCGVRRPITVTRASGGKSLRVISSSPRYRKKASLLRQILPAGRGFGSVGGNPAKGHTRRDSTDRKTYSLASGLSWWTVPYRYSNSCGRSISNSSSLPAKAFHCSHAASDISGSPCNTISQSAALYNSNAFFNTWFRSSRWFSMVGSPSCSGPRNSASPGTKAIVSSP